jgi:hypothetical protein
MSFTPPEFSEPVALDAERAWTAVYDSYDQRNDDVYFRITVRGPDGESSLMAQIGMYWAGDEWTGPDFRERLQNELHKVALSGKSNTTYIGSPYAR